MKINLATVCDKNYLVRALTMYRSAKAQMPEARIWFLCMDQETKRLIERLHLPDTMTKTPEELGDTELMAAKTNRQSGEFAMTTKAAWLAFIVKTAPLMNDDILAFVDADIYFFGPLKKIVDNMKNSSQSIGITSHRFPKKVDESLGEKVGRYNSGFEIFIIDENSRRCIADWRRDCIDWCYLTPMPGGLGDQRYLTYWPEKYAGVYEIPDKGVNAGSWNLPYFKFNERAGRFFLDKDPIICYHFHRIQFYLDDGKIKPLPLYVYKKKFYELYVGFLTEAWNLARTIEPDWRHGFATKPDIFRQIKQTITRQLGNMFRIK